MLININLFVGDELQRGDLIREFHSDANARFNFILCKNSTVKKHGFIQSLSGIFDESYRDSIIKYRIEDQDVEVSFRFLLNNELKSLDGQISFPIFNFMFFTIGPERAQAPIDEALELSLKAELRTFGQLEKIRLLNYIKMLNRIKAETILPIINVCQSSGCGKTKIAKELMDENASIYMVFRNSGSSQGYPYSSFISSLFDVKESEEPESVMLQFALVLKAILSDYFVILPRLLAKYQDQGEVNPLKRAFMKICDMFFDGTFADTELNDLRTAHNISNSTTSMEEVTSACNGYINQIKELVDSFGADNSPLIFVFDEASLLANRKTKNGLNHFRLLGRVLSKLDKNSSFVALTLGTNSDVLDLNSQPTVDSFREDVTTGLLVPPFIINRNWDIFLDKVEMKRLQIGYQSLLCGRIVIFRLSLGRPVWSSVSFDRLIRFTCTKITNNSLVTGEAYLSFWMVRIAIQVNPVNIVCKHLVKSLMAHVKFISGDMRCLRIDYPSEPALAIGARVQLSKVGEVLRYYEFLERFVAAQAVDKGRMCEVISADICLQALDSAKAVEIENWDFNENLLPKICKKNKFILEDEADVPVPSTFSSSDLKGHFSNHHRIVTVESFIQRLFEEKLADLIIKYLPNLLLDALISKSHFNQMLRQFPFSDLNVEVCDFPCAQPEYERNNPCNVIANELLMTGIMRECSYLLPQSYFGLDHIIPVCLKPDEPRNTSRCPEYSYIGTQVKKRDVGNIQTVMAKCAISNHLVRCALHLNCKNINCDIRIPDATYKKIIGNGLVFIHVLESSGIEVKNPVYKAKVTSVQLQWKLHPKFGKHNKEIESRCPKAIFEKIPKNFGITSIKNSIYENSRFVPDLYVCIDMGANVKIHYMAKKHANNLIERLTAIETRGLKVFENVLPAPVAQVAKRIIDNDFTIFDEFNRSNGPIQYDELIQNVNYCNNSAVIPMADNILRHRINLPPVPDEVPKYEKVIDHKKV